jgi:hypothetical protein
MRWEGCKYGCFWTTFASGTCAKAVCSHLSQHQHGAGCQVKLCGCDCPFQLRKIPYSNFQTHKPLKILRMLIYLAIKHYKEIWRAEDRARSERLKSVRAEATIKTIWGRISRNPLWKQIMSWKLNISTQSSRASSGTIYMRVHLRPKGHLLNPALKEIWQTRAKRLLQWHAENGHKNIVFMEEKIFTIEEQYNNQYNKIYALMSLQVRSEGARGHHPSYVMVRWGVSHQGVTPLHFCEHWCPCVSRGCATRSCETS